MIRINFGRFSRIVSLSKWISFRSKIRKKLYFWDQDYFQYSIFFFLSQFFFQVLITFYDLFILFLSSWFNQVPNGHPSNKQTFLYQCLLFKAFLFYILMNANFLPLFEYLKRLAVPRNSFLNHWTSQSRTQHKKKTNTEE